MPAFLRILQYKYLILLSNPILDWLNILMVKANFAQCMNGKKNTLKTEEYLRALNEIKGIKFNNTLINVNSQYTAAVMAAFLCMKGLKG